MNILTWVSLILYGVFVLVIILGVGEVKFNDQEVTNPFARGLIALVVWPIIGLIFSVLGFIGWFLLAPFGALLGGGSL